MTKDTELLDPVEQQEMKMAFAQAATGQEIAIHQPTTVDITEGVITARKVEVRRDEPVILQKIASQAAAAGEHWYYAFPVKKRGGGTDTIEGPSIKCANAVARLYGNCQVDCRVLDAGKNWIIYARFVDYETGFSLTRPFQQSKTGSQLGGKDDERREQAALSIGVSKAERNVICNALETFTDYAFEAAKANLVARVGKRLDEYKQRVIDRLGELGVATLRAERSIGKTVDSWIARDVAKLIAEIKSVQDGMATADETWPAEAPPEPRRSEVDDIPKQPSAEPNGGDGGPATAGSPTAQSPPERVQSSPDLSMPLESWRVADDVLGQENIIKALDKLIGLAETVDDLDAVESENAERLSKITGNRRATLNVAFRAKRESLA